MGAAALIVAVGLALGAAAPQRAAAAFQPMLKTHVHVGGTFQGPCFDGLQPGPGSGIAHFKVPYFGYLRLTIAGGSGDWDLAAFSAGRVVTAAASTGPVEVATGYALEGETISVQVCRNPGAAGAPTVRAELERMPSPQEASSPQILQVATPTAADRATLARSGLDVTPGPDPSAATVVAYGARDRNELDAVGLDYEVAPHDPAVASTNELRREDRRQAKGLPAPDPSMPSGRTSYRRLFDYEQEMKDLAAAHPNLARVFTLPQRTGEGRPVEALELGDHPGAEEGEPVYMHMGLHHAREWPAGEIAMESAYELLDSAAAGKPRALKLLADTKTIVVPVVNPDGFNISREAGQLRADFGQRSGDPGATIAELPAEMHRKNCHIPASGGVGDCGAATSGSSLGVDVNRNYGGLWGGSGGGISRTAADYRGPAPFSEPETRNVRSLFSNNQVTAAFTDHTFSALMLRPPLIDGLGEIPDQALYRRLGGRLARETGFKNKPVTYLYPTSGGMEGWSYYSLGSIDFTPEIGRRGFHPAYSRVIGQWAGTTKAADGNGGMRRAGYNLQGFARRHAGHLVVTGDGPTDGTILFRKSFKTTTLPVSHRNREPTAPIKFRDRLRSRVDVGPDGSFTANLNPSTRPILNLGHRHGHRERWRLICLDSTGRKLGHRWVTGGRGDVVHVKLGSDC